MMKFGFNTESVNGWPPFEVEHIWLDLTDDGYVVKNTPFYTRGISYEDKIEIVSIDGIYIDSWNLMKSSGNSTVWVMEIKKNAFKNILRRIQSIDCLVEAGIPNGYYSVTVPLGVRISQFEELINKVVSNKQVSVAYATLRHTS